MDAIFQVVRCFDDAEIIHVEGDVDPVRDLTIISEELRIKDIEFTEKALENIKKQTRRGGQSLEMKKLKEEEATIEKILAWLKDGKDVRKENWSPKEVSFAFPFAVNLCMMNKSYNARHNPSSLSGSIYNAETALRRNPTLTQTLITRNCVTIRQPWITLIRTSC